MIVEVYEVFGDGMLEANVVSRLYRIADTEPPEVMFESDLHLIAPEAIYRRVSHQGVQRDRSEERRRGLDG